MPVRRTVTQKHPVASVVAATKSTDKASTKEATTNVRKSDSQIDHKSTDLQSKPKKYCHFCQSKTIPHYWDSNSLKRYINDRGRIVPKARTGTCSKHQRWLSREIKRSRHLAMLPFVVRI
ncbi:30S ribosomal protein S18 [Patescibacteria group bacterium]|nr:30S ribosomal protein S18 [Patescibacteria group bacterium]MCL5409718.1 30S ribosomal protein S18 [Patescibacteria group bacterium]